MIASPTLLAQVTTKLAEGPAVHSDPVEIPTGGLGRIVILWRELPQRVAAVLAIIGGVLWLLVSPTAPAAAAQATQLVHEHLAHHGPVITQTAQDPGPTVPRPRKRAPREVLVTQPNEKRRDSAPVGTAPA